jgi:hypothetical protein
MHVAKFDFLQHTFIYLSLHIYKFLIQRINLDRKQVFSLNASNNVNGVHESSEPNNENNFMKK